MTAIFSTQVQGRTKGQGTKYRIMALLSVMRGLSLRSSFGMPSEAVRKFLKKVERKFVHRRKDVVSLQRRNKSPASRGAHGT